MSAAETVLVGNAQLSNTAYFTARTAFVEDNRNGDAMRPLREDYAVYLRSPEVGEAEPVLGEWPVLDAGKLELVSSMSVGTAVEPMQLLTGSAEGDAAVMQQVADGLSVAVGAAAVPLVEVNEAE